MFLYYFHISIFMYCSFPIFPYLVYFHITDLILFCIFIYILILFIYDTFVCFNLVLFMYCTFICLLLISSLSSFISMTYYILCTITYIIYFPIPISSLLSCSGYTPMLCYSFLTYCFIIYFLIRTCIVIYFHFILYCHIVLSYIFILYFSYTIIVTTRIPVRPDRRIRTEFGDARLRTGTLYLIFFLKANWHLWVMAHIL